MQTHATTSQSSEPAKSNSPSSPALAPLGPQVQRLGNRNLQALLSARMLQPKLTVSDPQDPFELEADRVAEQVMRTPDASLPASRQSAPRIQRVCNECEEELHRSEESSTTVPAVDAATESSILALSGRGSSLPDSVRSFMEPRFRADFSAVRVHDDPSAHELARSVNAQAFTVGHDVVFAAGRYAPETDNGRRLLAHELTHVVQQSGAGRNIAQRRPDDAKTVSPEAQSSPGDAPLHEVKSRDSTRVYRVVISCSDMKLKIETAGKSYRYDLDRCEIRPGSYEAAVKVKNGNVFWHFDPQYGRTDSFYFRYRVKRGQENPATLFRGQSKVRVDVVDRLPADEREPKPKEKELAPQCLLASDDRQLVAPDSLNKRLFDPKKFNRTLWSHKVPLGQFGWVDLAATASGSLSGNLAASYGPGMLTDICLTHVYDKDTERTPGEGDAVGKVDKTTFALGGRAKFKLPARASVRIVGDGRLKIAGDYLSVIEVAAAEGALKAQGEATLSGTIDASVEVLARATRTSGASTDPLTRENTKVDSVDITAAIGLRGKAGLKFSVDLSAGFKLAGFNLWSQTWNLAQFDAGISWGGGVKYDSKRGIQWDLGTIGAKSIAENENDREGGIETLGQHPTEAAVDEGGVVQALLEERNAHQEMPTGDSPDDALPFDWYKPLELYPRELHFPNATDKQTANRFDGPELFHYISNGRLQSVEIGVKDWPAVRKTFQYVPYDPGNRETPNQARFNRELDALGFDRSGFDAEHVWDVKLLGLEHDRFDNLWPASNQEQQLAGTRHMNQIRSYRTRLGNVDGRWFRIVRFRHPA